MSALVTSSPSKIILCGDHGVNRAQPALSTASDMRTLCRVATRNGTRYSLRSGDQLEEGDRERLRTFKAQVDQLRETKQLDDIRDAARDFFAPTRYVLAYVVDRVGGPGLDVVWRSDIPVSSGLGSGAAASTAMALAAYRLCGHDPTPAEVIWTSWQGDIIAHGGIASALDSSTSVYGGLIRFTVAEGAVPLPISSSLPLVVGQSFVPDRSTAKLNTIVRKYLEDQPARMHLFRDMGWLVRQIEAAIAAHDLPTLGHLFNLHNLIQAKIGTVAPENEAQIEAAIAAGALGAKVSGAGGGGIIIALTELERQADVIAAIATVGGWRSGRAFAVSTGAPGTRVEPEHAWEQAA